MKRVLEWSGMWIVVVGFVIVGLGLVVLIATENVFFYALVFDNGKTCQGSGNWRWS